MEVREITHHTGLHLVSGLDDITTATRNCGGQVFSGGEWMNAMESLRT